MLIMFYWTLSTGCCLESEKKEVFLPVIHPTSLCNAQREGFIQPESKLWVFLMFFPANAL